MILMQSKVKRIFKQAIAGKKNFLLMPGKIMNKLSAIVQEL